LAENPCRICPDDHGAATRAAARTRNGRSNLAVFENLWLPGLDPILRFK